MGSNEKGMRHDNSKILGFGGAGFGVWWFVIKNRAPETVKAAEGRTEEPTEEKKDEE